MLAMSAGHRTHYFAWAGPFSRDVNNAVDALLDTDLYYLWHGHPLNRKYNARHHTLRQFHLDPPLILAHTNTEPWRWNSAKPVITSS